jgi:hypothetical protein
VNGGRQLSAVVCRLLLPALLALGVLGARTKPSSANPVVCIDPGHPSEVSLGDERLNGTTEIRAYFAKVYS